MARAEILERYEAACAASAVAYWIFDPIRMAFRAGKISEDVFLAALAAYKAVKADFDVAFAAVIELSEEEA